MNAERLPAIAAAVGVDESKVPCWPAGEGKIKLPAAWLLEQAGFVKGYGVGRAGISTRHTLALTKGGTIVGWGAGTGNRGPVERGQDVVPPGLTNVVQMAAGMYHSLIRQRGSPPTVTAPLTVYGITSNTFNLTVPSQAGRVYQLEYVGSLNNPDWSQLPLCAGNGGILELSDPTAAGVPQRFYRLNRW